MQFIDNKKMKSIWHKMPKVLLTLVITLSTFLGNFSTAQAYGSFQYIGEVTDRQGQYGSAKVGDFRVDGRQAFCIEHHKPTPATGASFREEIYGNERLKKALYYGWDGIKPWNGFKSRKNGIVVTSLALSLIYAGEESIGGSGNKGGNTDLGVFAFLDYIDSQKLPDDRISFTPESVTANLSSDKTYQETPWITMNGDNNITVTLQNEVTLIKKDGSEHQNSVTIYGGEQFYLKAPLSVHGQWATGDIKGNLPEYQPIVLKNNNSRLQDIGYLKILTDPTESGGFEVNWLSTGSLKIAKIDEDGAFVPNTSFKLSYNQDMSDPIGTYTTAADGTVTIDELAPKAIYIQEVSVPDHLVLDSKVYNITVKTSETVTFTANNNFKKGYIQVVKKDVDTGKTIVASNTTFDIHKQDGSVIGTITTNSQGVATSELLRYGDYYLTEKTAPNGYVQSSERVSYQLREDGKTYEAVLSNKRVVASVEIVKEDTVTNNVAQGEATLENAVYGLYARENIVDPADGTVIHQANAKVTELVTDENGHASTNNLYLGKYYIKEITAPTGYVLDETEYDIALDYQGQNVSVVTKNQVVKDRVKSQAFSIIKISDNGNGESDLLEGVEFTIKAKKDIAQYGSWEAAPIAKNAKGQEASLLITDKKGYALSDELPYGTYVVRETKAPDDHYKVPDFEVVVNEDNREPQPWRVFNDEKFQAVVAMVKQDVDTGKTVALAGTTFKIKNLQTNEYVGYWEWFPLPHYVTEWKTDESGQVFTGDVLNFGEYQIEEIKAPNGYLLNTEPVRFTISLNGAFETLPDGKTPVVTVKMQDKAVKGQINISKIGEQLVSTTTDQNGNIQFVYENKPVNGATFIIEADENIYSADNQQDLIYAKGQKVAELTTTDGLAQSEQLPLGKYAVYEKTAADGFVLNKEVKKVELTYENQNVPIVFEDVDFENQRQKVNVSVTKKDQDNDILLQGATFGLYATEDIYSVTNQLLVSQDQLIETVVTDENGQANFKADLPINAHFEMREISAPLGYVNTDEIVAIDTTYQGQDQEVITFEPVIKNQITKVEVSKKDITNNEEIAGAELSIYPKDNKGEIIATWVSGQDGRYEDGTIKPHIVQGLEVGKTYILKENVAPYGYAITQEVEFTVEATGEIQKVEMKDSMVFGQLKWNKKGSIFNDVTLGQNEFGQTHEPLFTESNLLDTEITIYAAQDITIGNHTYYKADEKIQVLESDWEAVLSQKLPVGRYYYVETKVPFGYVQDLDRHYFEIEDSRVNELQTVTSDLFNVRAKVTLNMKKSLEEQQIFTNKEAYKDVVFGLYAREDVTDYMGHVAIKHDSLISTSGIDENGNLVRVPELPIGKYYIKELQTNEQYQLSDKEYDFEITYHGPSVKEFTIDIGQINNELVKGSVELIKHGAIHDASTNEVTHELLKGAEYSIYSDKKLENLVQKTTTDENGKIVFENLEKGTYYIKETKAPVGYELSEQVFEVTIKDQHETLKIEALDEQVLTAIQVNKVDSVTKEAIVSRDFEFTLYKDKECKEVIRTVAANQTNGTATFYNLPFGTYYVKETKAPLGYELSSEVKEIVINEQLEGVGDIHSFIYENTLLPFEGAVTGDTTHLLFPSLFALLSAAGFIFVLKKRKKEEL